MQRRSKQPGRVGDYFAWGETEPKDDYTWANYKYSMGSETKLTKYCTESQYGYDGFMDGKGQLESKDDAASCNWDGYWQTPSHEQQMELINSEYTTVEQAVLNGVKGYRITSRSNGNSIFLPAAGIRYDSKFEVAGQNGIYWSRTLTDIYCPYPYTLCLTPEIIDYGYSPRYFGRPVRPVRIIIN